MITALFALFVGWLLGLIGLDSLLHNVIGLSEQGYYISWFAMGLVIWLVKLIKS